MPKRARWAGRVNLFNFCMTGSIKKLVTEKGFGFVIDDETRGDIFFHAKDMGSRDLLFSDLKEGMRISYDRMDGPKGPRGVNVMLLNE